MRIKVDLEQEALSDTATRFTADVPAVPSLTTLESVPARLVQAEFSSTYTKHRKNTGARISRLQVPIDNAFGVCRHNRRRNLLGKSSAPAAETKRKSFSIYQHPKLIGHQKEVMYKLFSYKGVVWWT